MKLKLQKMKDARDYSFLLSDDAKAQHPLRKQVSAPNPAGTSAKIPEKTWPVLKERKPVSLNGKNARLHNHQKEYKFFGS